MISQNQIARLVETQEYRQLVDRILTNGRCRSAAAARALRHPHVVAVAGVGLGLQRLAEITYRPTVAAAQLADRLIALQRQDGLFGGGDEDASRASLIAATAVALRGLITWQGDGARVGGVPAMSAAEPIRRGLEALSGLARQGGSAKGDGVAWAIVLWQLGDLAEFRRALNVDQLLHGLGESDADLVEDELCRYARAMAA